MIRYCLLTGMIIGAMFFVPAHLLATWQEDQDVARAVRQIQKTADLPRTKGKDLRRKMDAAWELFLQHKVRSFETLKRLLREEIEKTRPDQVFLFEGARFLIAHERPVIDDVAFDALRQVLDQDEAVCRHRPLLGHSLYTALADGVRDERLFEVVDKFFLLTSEKIAVTFDGYSRVLNADETVVYLYGAFSPEGEWHIARLLNQRVKNADRILYTLAALGTPYSNDYLVRLIRYGLDDRSLGAALTCLLANGGPIGREAVLRLDLQRLNDRQKVQYAKVRKQAEAMNFKSLRHEIALGKIESLPDTEVKARLAKAIAAKKGDPLVSPAALLNSTVPSIQLMADLMVIRNHLFLRPTDRDFSQVRAINRTLNALRYRVLEWREQLYKTP